MKEPLVSVVMPAYNHGRYIGRSIDSLVAQTYKNWELVVVDDGSTDNTAEVVKSYKDPRITCVYQDNQGVAALAKTINSGVRRTSGELVTMLPSDDLWPPYRLEKQVPVFQEPNVVLCFGGGCVIDESDKVLGRIKPPGLARVQNRPPGSILHGLLVGNFMLQTSVLISRAALDRIGGYIQPEGLLAEDYPTHLALALQGEFRYLDMSLGYYRMHSSQMTRTHHIRMVQTDLDYVMTFFRSLDPQTQKITGWTESGLAKALSHQLNNANFYVGRRELLAGNKASARRHFVAALRLGDPKTKIKALLGLGCYAVGIDLEWVAKLLRQTPLR